MAIFSASLEVTGRMGVTDIPDQHSIFEGNGRFSINFFNLERYWKRSHEEETGGDRLI